MPAKFPCKICNNPVAKNHKAVCDNCGLWIHIKCNKINAQTYKYLQKESCVWYCIPCSSKIFPFSNLNEDDFHKTIHGKKVKFLTITKKERNQNKQMLIEKLNDAIDKKDLEKSSSYFPVNELNNTFSENEFNGTNFLHMNISSICRRFDELETLLVKINVKFDVIGITETRLKKSFRNINIDLNHNTNSASFLDSLYIYKLSSAIYLNTIPSDNTF